MYRFIIRRRGIGECLNVWFRQVVIPRGWSIENNLHWQLVVSFKEDQRRIRKGNGTENFSRLCRIALNLLNRKTTNKKGIDSRQKDAGWDDQYMLKVVAA